MCKKIFFFVHNDSRECHNSHLNVMTLPRLNLSFRSRIGQVFFAGLLQNFMQIFGGFPACHRQIHQQIISAVAWSGSGNFAFVSGNEAESFLHQRQNVA